MASSPFQSLMIENNPNVQWWLQKLSATINRTKPSERAWKMLHYPAIYAAGKAVKSSEQNLDEVDKSAKVAEMNWLL